MSTPKGAAQSRWGYGPADDQTPCLLRGDGLAAGEQVPELLRAELVALAEADYLALLGLDLLGGLRDVLGDLDGDGGNAVLVGVEEVAGAHDDASHLHRDAHLDHLHVSVRRDDVARVELEAHRLGFV